MGRKPTLFDILPSMNKGKVFLIGAGPGDPGLLTLKGRDVLSRADVVVHDALINPRILDWTRPGATRIFVGKRGGHHTMEQSKINALLLRQARRGRRVARLKGGDPFLFGRGSEEALYLAQHRIPFEVIPGVTAASGAAAYAGIPLTDRSLGSMVTLVTGHEGLGKADALVEWSRISRKSTLVIYMGLEQLPVITDRLLHLNWDPRTPAAIVRWASTSSQITLEGTLDTIADQAQKASLKSPVIILIGRVASLRRSLRWFDTKPLFGKKIVITRAADQAHEFAWLLEDAGAEVFSFPTIQVLPPQSWGPVDQAIRRLALYDWILFTSVNGVTFFFSRLKEIGGDIRDLKGIRIGAIGPKTAARLEALGLRVDLFPGEYRAEALADALGNVKGQKVLLARAQEARDVLPDTLSARGASVTIASVYQTIKVRRVSADLKRRLLGGEMDAVTFTSSSTVDGFMLHFNARERKRIFEKTRAAAIGPITAQTLKTYDIRPAIRAPRYTIESLAKALVKHFA